MADQKKCAVMMCGNPAETVVVYGWQVLVRGRMTNMRESVCRRCASGIQMPARTA